MNSFNFKTLKKIGVYTSGGDASGMNAAIRSVVRVAISQGLEVVGVRHGYGGMLEGDIIPMDLRSVANVIQRGGTLLKTGRSSLFFQEESRIQAVEVLKSHGIEALICIGGDGSMRGARCLWEEHGIPIVSVPATIDNDVPCTETTVGFDTSVNTALEAIDRIRDTASSHDRLFIVEVMGRDSGFIALDVGLAGGAEEVFIPEHPTSVDQAIEHIKRGLVNGKMNSILITAEGQKVGRGYDLAEAIRKKSGLEAKVCILGHIQRGGAPTAGDRILASQMGAAAVTTLCEGFCDVMIGRQNGQFVRVPLEEVLATKKSISKDLIELIQVLSN